MAWMMASMSAKPVRMIRTVVGVSAKTRARNSTPVISGMRWSEITTATGPVFSSSSSPSRAEDEVWTS